MGAVKRMIGEKLERELAARGWDQKELAARTGVNEATISRHINNKRVPTTEIVTKYAEALGLGFADLLGLSADEQDGTALPTRIAAERALHRLPPNARLAVEDFDWSSVRPEEEQSIVHLLGFIDVGDDDPEVAFWTSRIEGMLRLIRV